MPSSRRLSKTPRFLLLASILAGSVLAACGAAQSAGTATPEGEGGGDGAAKGPGMTPPASLDDQLRLGAQLFEEECAGCHGSDGTGKKSSPPIMGPNALPEIPPAGALRRTVPFKTAKDVLDWTAESMPYNDPASLDPVQYAAIVAHQLSVLGVDLKGAPLTPDSGATILLR